MLTKASAGARSVVIDGERIPVVDAPLPAALRVTRGDIEQSVRGDPRHCVIANAARRSLGSEYAIVWKTVALFEIPAARGRERTMYRYAVPERTRTLIATYDAGEDVEPGEYPLNVPSDHAQIGALHRPGDGSRPNRYDGPRTPRVWVGPRGNFSLRLREDAD